MAITAIKGPLNVFGASPLASTLPATPTGFALDYNGEASPSLFLQGMALADPRRPFAFYPGGATSNQGTRGGYGWFGTGENIIIHNQVPSTVSTTAIAAAQVPSAGTPLTLVTSTGGGITVGVSIVNSATGTTVSGLLAIDGAMGFVQPDSAGGNYIWDPTKALARCVQINSVGNDSGATFTVAGYDIYGYPMTSTVTGATAGNTAITTKAFKYVASITPAGTLSGSNVSAGQGDTYGLMLRADLFQYLKIYWPDTTLIASSTGFTAAVTTNPATSSTGDVRGTYALQGTASNGTRRLIIYLALPLANVTAGFTGLTGITQA